MNDQSVNRKNRPSSIEWPKAAIIPESGSHRGFTELMSQSHEERWVAE